MPPEVATQLAPVVRWHPWQQRAFDDRSRIAMDVWHRQAGKDFCTAGIAADDALATGNDWYIVSTTQRQADATFRKCRRFAEAMREVHRLRGTIEYGEYDSYQYDRWLRESFRFKARELTLPGGGRVVSLPGRDPNALAGLTGNLILTEFALFPGGGYDHWRVLFPLITRGYSIRVLTTPRGRNTKAYEIASDPETYTVRTQTIHDSVAEGFVLRGPDGEPISVEQFRRLYKDEAGWRREYECEWTGDLDTLIRWAQLERAGRLGAHLPFELLEVTGEQGAGWRHGFFAALSQVHARCEIGWDVARRHDLSVVWVNVAGGGGEAEKRLARLVIMRNVPFAAQRQIVREAMDSHPANVGCGDATGLGADSNETLQAAYGDRWQPVVFTTAAKSDLASGLMTCYGDGAQAIPPSSTHKLIHADLYALQREAEVGDARRIRVQETPNPLCDDSHCDIAWANALALRAGTIDAGPAPFLMVV